MNSDDSSTGSTRQFVILSGEDSSETGSLPAIGPRAEIVEKLARANTSPESNNTTDVLYGPGIRVELTPNQDPVSPMLVTVTEEEIGWQVLTRLINHFQWKLLDPNTGRELTPQSSS
jgi:hypothetical protein